MNLVQINERLKDLPMQVLQQYANGMNPEVPPYLALGELQRREMSQKQAATAQGGQQGPQPSVKEQVEQKAGLMALQQMQQQQMAQQQARPQGPMPAPAGVPQPEAQPEAMMARGGLASVPVRRDMFEYAGGGIIAFAGGGEVEQEIQDLMKARERYVRAGSDTSAIDQAIATLQERNAAPISRPTSKMTPQQVESPPSRQRYQLSTELGYNTSMPDAGNIGNTAYYKDANGNPRVTLRMDETGKPITDAEWNARKKELNTESAKTSQGPGDKIVPRYPQGGLPAALEKTGQPSLSPQAPTTAKPSTPGAPQAGLPLAAAAQGNVSPFIQEAAAMAREKPVAPTPESIIAEQNKLLPDSMKEEAVKKMLADQRARAEGRRSAYESSKPTGLDDLINVWGQAAQYKGGTGIAPAYTSMQKQRRAADLAMQKEQDDLLTAIEGRDYAAGKELFGAREKSLTSAQKSYQERLTTNTKTLADLANVDQRRIDEVAQRLTQMQVAKLQAATAARPSEAERIEAKYMGMIAKGQTKEAEDYLNTISKIKGGGPAGVGAENAQTRKLRDAVKDIDGRLETMTGKEPDYLSLKAQRDKLSKTIVERAIGEAGGGDSFTVTAGGKTYTFPTQEAANKFKAEAGVK
jgi:hypothetical protein